MTDFYEDERGIIQDIEDGVSVTHIMTVQGAVRGNHFHKETTQWTIVLVGRLMVADNKGLREFGPGTVARHKPGEPHAWRALEDTHCFVLTKGPRAKDYEADTFRLEESLL